MLPVGLDDNNPRGEYGKGLFHLFASLQRVSSIVDTVIHLFDRSILLVRYNVVNRNILRVTLLSFFRVTREYLQFIVLSTELAEFGLRSACVLLDVHFLLSSKTKKKGNGNDSERSSHCVILSIIPS